MNKLLLIIMLSAVTLNIAYTMDDQESNRLSEISNSTSYMENETYKMLMKNNFLLTKLVHGQTKVLFEITNNLLSTNNISSDSDKNKFSSIFIFIDMLTMQIQKNQNLILNQQKIQNQSLSKYQPTKFSEPIEVEEHRYSMTSSELRELNSKSRTNTPTSEIN